MSTNGHAPVASTSSSFLPDQPYSPTTFEGDVEREFDRRNEARREVQALYDEPGPNSFDQSGSSSQQPQQSGAGANGFSDLFPTVPRRTQGRPRANSSPSAPVFERNSTATTLLAYAREPEYGVDDDAEKRSLKLGGSRPPSRTSVRRSRYLSRRDSSYSAAPADSVDPHNNPLGYLFLDSSITEGEESPRLVNGVKKGKVGMNDGRRIISSQGIYDMSPQIPPLPGTEEQNGQGGERSEALSKEEAWYLLRALVGSELEWESGELWRLRELDTTEDMFGRGDGRDEESEDEDDDIDPRRVPILRYLIRHFLLTLPLVRDTAPGGGQYGKETPALWSDGLYPLIRAIHDADLSHEVDNGQRSIGSSIYGTYLHKAIERFVSAGLKLSSSTVSPPDHGYDGRGHRRGESGNTYNFQPHPYPTSSEEPGSPVFSTSAESSSPRSTRRFSFGNLFRGAASPSKPAAPVLAPQPPAPKPSTKLQRPPIPPRSLSRRSANSFSASPNPNSSSATNYGGATTSGDESPVDYIHPSASNNFAHSHPPPVPPIPQDEDQTMTRSVSRATGTTGFTSGLDDSASFVSAREDRTGGETTDDDDHEREGTTPMPFPSSSRPFPSSHALAKEKSADGATIAAVQSAGWFTGEGGSTSTPTQELDDPMRHRPYVVDDEGDRTINYSDLQSANAALDSNQHFSASTLVDDSQRAIPARSSSRQADPIADKKGLFSRLRNKASSDKLPKSQKSFEVLPVNHTDIPGVAPLHYHPRDSLGADSNDADDDGDLDLDRRNTVVAHMAIPESAMHGGRPVRSAPLAVELVPKGGTPWPYGTSVAFWRGTPYEKLKWGGFEADLVGVRNGLFSHSYIIRVRRPQRLDEYVLRSESQFLKYFKVLDAQYPNAHIRRIPTTDPKDDVVIKPRPNSAANSVVSVATARRTESPHRDTLSCSGSRSRLASGLREAANDPYSSSSAQSSKRNSVSSVFAKTLRQQSYNGELKAVRSRRATISGPARPYSVASNRSAGSLPSRVGLTIDMKKLPPHDPRRRALRAWLRDTLSVRTIGHHRETAAFLLLGSIQPKDADFTDMFKREAIDAARRSARVGVAQAAPERVRAARGHWQTIEHDLIHGEGFVAISDAIRQCKTIDALPARFFKAVESTRYGFAQSLYDMLLGGESSGVIFGKLKALHSAFPYFLVRQAFKISRSRTMSRYLQDILLARPFGSKSLLQKILAITLDDDPKALLEQINRYRIRIGSSVAAEKLEIFVYESREKKEVIRQYARENNVELVLAIIRGADEPRLPPQELERVIKASKKYKSFLKTKPSPLAKAQVDDPDVRFVLDLQYYLRLVSRDRDSNIVRQLLGEDDVAAALEVVAGPFVEFIRRIYKVGNASQALSNLQKFLDQLIIIVEALRSRIQDPQKSVRILARLLARHQANLYSFVRDVHRGDSIIEEFLQWFWTASVFLRRGLAEPVNLDAVLPQDKEEKLFLFDELEDLVTYHRQCRNRTYQNSCRRYAGDVDADDPVVVEGDGKGKSKVEPFGESIPVKPYLVEIPSCLDGFRDQLKHVFAV